MKIRNHFRVFLALSFLFVSLGAFSQGSGSNPMVKKFGKKLFLSVGNDNSKSFTPSADGVLVEVNGRNYMVEGIQVPFTITPEEEESSGKNGQTQTHQKDPNSQDIKIPKPNLVGESGQIGSSENAGETKCGMESDTTALLDYVEELAIKERKNLGIADKPDELLPVRIKGKINDKKMVIEDYIRFKYHLAAGQALSDFHSILGKPIGAPSKPKIDLKKLFKNGTEVTQEGIQVNLAQDLEENVNLKVHAKQISSDEFFTPDCNFTETLNAGERSVQYTFADKCAEFNTAQEGGKINYRLYLNNESAYFKNGSIVVTGK